ncbi:MAG: UDP-N-acetylglucosamine 2-epimerase (non-hydrolyzing) [Armatimonadota bacterium]|nr:MAG: UDP-N-acetylglucosamine 2-epimerase (non-hydrolyzing) [Armatimonadota bacterium]
MGTRPEAIKMAPVVRELRRFPDVFETRVIATAQHRRLADEVLDLFDIEPDYDLDVMTARQSLTRVTSRLLQRLEPALADARPHLVLVQGDAATAFAGALAAYYQQIPVGHVEAGLRTRDKHNPFPEEIFRRLVTPIADLHFAPTSGARQALIGENVDRGCIHVTGNTVIDALFSVAEQDHPLPSKVRHALGRADRRIILVTAHRRENWGKPLLQICGALRTLARDHPDLLIVYALHPNPAVSEAVRAQLAGEKHVVLIKAPPYERFVSLMKRSYAVLTDSGGLQEEAPALGKPVLVLRRTTERPEGIAAGVAKLVGVEQDTIVAAAGRLLSDGRAYLRMARASNPYGDGRAAQRIRQAILHHFDLGVRPRDFKVA